MSKTYLSSKNSGNKVDKTKAQIMPTDRVMANPQMALTLLNIRIPIVSNVVIKAVKIAIIEV